MRCHYCGRFCKFGWVTNNQTVIYYVLCRKCNYSGYSSVDTKHICNQIEEDISLGYPPFFPKIKYDLDLFNEVVNDQRNNYN